MRRPPRSSSSPDGADRFPTSLVALGLVVLEPELYTLAEEKLANAARDGSGLLARAERNTRLMLQGLLRALGFIRVEVRFSEV